MPDEQRQPDDLIQIDRPCAEVPAQDAADRRRTLLIVGTGWHCLTKVLDASNGEDIGAQLGISRIEWRVGDSDAYPRARLIFEVLCPVIIEINPDEEKPGSASSGALAGGAESDRVDRSA